MRWKKKKNELALKTNDETIELENKLDGKNYCNYLIACTQGKKKKKKIIRYLQK